MPSAWRNIDPTLAEQQVRNLRKRIVGAEAEIEAFKSFLDFTKLTFADKLSIESLGHYRDNLHKTLRDLINLRESEVVTLALNGPEFPRHSASFESLADILRSVQRLFTSVVQAMTTGPTTRGPVPTAVAHTAQLRLAEIYPSSFGMVIEVGAGQNYFGRAVVERSLDAVFELLNSPGDSDLLLDRAGNLGTRTIGHYKALIRALKTTGTIPKLEWNDPSGKFNIWTLDSEQIEHISSALDGISTERTEEKQETGILVGASLLKGTFELLTDYGSVVEGRIAETAFEPIRDLFAARCIASLTINSILNRLTGTSKSVTTLTGIRPAADDTPPTGLAPISG